jgi:hypothetical protein
LLGFVDSDDRLLVGEGGFDLDFENYSESILAERLRQRINKVIYEPIQVNMWVGFRLPTVGYTNDRIYGRSISWDRVHNQSPHELVWVNG